MKPGNIALFDEARGLYFAPIRHHSPACAWHLRALLAEVKPRQVLIEAPIDFEPLIPLLLDAGTRPPIAIVAFEQGSDKDETRRISYYPFSSHAPEYIALVDGSRLEARLGFIDLPAGVRLGLREVEGRPDTIALSFADERPFDTSAYTRALCRRTGCRDQNELWDHLFETQPVAKANSLNRQRVIQKRKLLEQGNQLTIMRIQSQAKEVSEMLDHVASADWIGFDLRGDRVQGVEKEMWINLQSQRSELGLCGQSFRPLPL